MLLVLCIMTEIHQIGYLQFFSSCMQGVTLWTLPDDTRSNKYAAIAQARYDVKAHIHALVVHQSADHQQVDRFTTEAAPSVCS